MTLHSAKDVDKEKQQCSSEATCWCGLSYVDFFKTITECPSSSTRPPPLKGVENKKSHTTQCTIDNDRLLEGLVLPNSNNTQNTEFLILPFKEDTLKKLNCLANSSSRTGSERKSPNHLGKVMRCEWCRSLYILVDCKHWDWLQALDQSLDSPFKCTRCRGLAST